MCLVNIRTVTRGTVKQVCTKYCYLGRALSQKTSQCAQSINAKVKLVIPRNSSVCPKCHGSRRTLFQGTGQFIIPSVTAHEEPRPKGPVSLFQVSWLMKNLVPRDRSVCPKCRGSQRTPSQGNSLLVGFKCGHSQRALC